VLRRIIVSSHGKQLSYLSEIKVLIVDERKLFRQGLISLFSTELGILVVGDTGDGLDALDIISERKPHVVILNISLPGLDGISLARRLRKTNRPPNLVFLTIGHNELLMREAFAMGARSYLMQSCDFKELVLAVRKAAAGDFYLTGPAGRDMVLEYVTPNGNGDGQSKIMTRREKELARLLADGYSTKEAADRLSMSVKTAETHRASIMKKLNAKNVTDIVKYCIRNKIVDL